MSTITFLGTGSSAGIPVIGCTCDACTSSDPRNRRTRTSLAIRHGDTSIVIDTTPEFRLQMLENNIDKLDALIFTHSHADHIMGLADVRAFNYKQKSPVPIYGSDVTLKKIAKSFSFIFEAPPFLKKYYPQVDVKSIRGEFSVNGLTFEPLNVFHGNMPVLGFRFGKTAYITDANNFPEEVFDRLNGLDILVLEAFGYDRHISHLSLDESVAIAQRIGAKRTYLTHISHALEHIRTEKELPKGISLAYDRLTILVE